MFCEWEALNAKARLLSQNKNIDIELDLIENNKWEPKYQLPKNFNDNKTIKTPLEKLKDIIKAFTDLHIKQIDRTDDVSANLNFIQHLFSFEDEMTF